MRIRSGAPQMYAAMGVAGAITLAFCGTYYYLMVQDGRATWFLALFLTPFFMVGAALFYFGVRGVLRHLRYGGWDLAVPDGGGVLGQPLPVTLYPSRAFTATAAFQCRFRCVRVAFAGSGARPGQTELWSSAWTEPAATLLPATGLALALPLPEDGEESRESRLQGSAVVWQLNVVVTALGVSDEPVFELPVRRA